MDEFNRENQNGLNQNEVNPKEGNQESGENRMPQYEAATYSYKKTDLGAESTYYSNNTYQEDQNTAYSNNTYQNADTHNYGSTQAAGGKGNKKPRKSSGFAKKAGKVVASAMAFGLVAGLVFQGVNRTADILFPREQNTVSTTIQSTPQITPTATVTDYASTDLTQLVENTMPSIVSITSTVTQDFSYFGQVYSQEYDGSGSGIIVGQDEDELFIATNNHVVDGAKAIAVNFINNEVYEAKIKGTDAAADLAVVSVSTKDMDEDTLKAIKVAALGDSDSVKVGQMAVAIGNALGSGQSVTVGYISAKNRQINSTGTSQGSQLELLQTDAAINPGNSGGALLNVNGEVIGINDMKYTDTSIEGMGYAIPISEAIPIINDLMNREILTDDEKGYLGITGNDITDANNYYDMPTGVWVSQVISGGAAEEGGMKKGDIIVKINGAAAKTMEAVAEKVNSTRAGTEITVTVMRSVDGEYQELDLKITLKNKSSVEDHNAKASGSTKKGNFGYDQENETEDENAEESRQPSAPSDSSTDEQDINDIFNQFFNQFN